MVSTSEKLIFMLRDWSLLSTLSSLLKTHLISSFSLLEIERKRGFWATPLSLLVDAPIPTLEALNLEHYLPPKLLAMASVMCSSFRIKMLGEEGETIRSE